MDNRRQPPPQEPHLECYVCQDKTDEGIICLPCQKEAWPNRKRLLPRRKKPNPGQQDLGAQWERLTRTKRKG